jgi:tagatose 6-phosphate kinase
LIATVTLNTALDRILFLRRFRMGRRIVADDALTVIGGKGTVVSSLLRRMGAPTRAYGFVAGPAGHILCALLDRDGIPYEFVEAEGDTRINTVLVDAEARNQTTVIVESLKVGEGQIEKMESLIRQRSAETRLWVFSGSLPPGAPPDLWARLIGVVGEAGGRVLFDSSGEGLRQGIRAKPFLVKPNLQELEEAVGRSLPSREHARDAAESLLSGGPEWVVATLGDDGLLAVSGEQSFFLPPLDLPVVSTSGAGDGVMSGIALGLERGTDMAAALRLGAAVAASVVTQPSTCDCDPSDVERTFRQIRPEPLT